MDHTHSNDNQSSLGIQTEPESEINLSMRYEYPVEFRHLNCAEYGKSPAAQCQEIRYGLATFQDYGASVPTKCVGGAHMEVRGQFIHLCPGACNLDSANPDANTVERLRDAAQSFYRSVHPTSDRPVEIVGLRMNWSPGIPTYPLGQSVGRPHSSAVTGGHLGLLQARGQTDTIQVDILSCDRVTKHVLRQYWRRILSNFSGIFETLVSKLSGKHVEVLKTISTGDYGKILIMAMSGSLVVLLSSRIPLGS